MSNSKTAAQAIHIATTQIAYNALDLAGMLCKPEFRCEMAAIFAMAAAYACYTQALNDANPARRAEITIVWQEHQAFCEKLLSEELAKAGVTWPLSA